MRNRQILVSPRKTDTNLPPIRKFENLSPIKFLPQRNFKQVHLSHLVNKLSPKKSKIGFDLLTRIYQVEKLKFE